MSDEVRAGSHPYAFTVVLVIVYASVLVLSGGVTTALGLPEVSLYLIANVVMAVLAAILLTRMGWWWAIGFRPARRALEFLLFLLPAAPVVFNCLGFRMLPIGDILTFLALAALVGFVEEAFFRGLMLRPLALWGRWRAVIITSVVFGLMHSQHLLRGTDPSAVLMQMGFATTIGFTYAALVIRTGMIWPLMIIHCLTDFAGFVAAGRIENTFTVDLTQGLPGLATYLVVFVGYAVWLLWKRRPYELYLAEKPGDL